MIIGEFTNSNYDNYEEDSYEYLFKSKPKAVRQEKRMVRKENKQLKKTGLLPGKRRSPFLGNFGMFDKNKPKNAIPSSTSVQVGVPAAESTAEVLPIATESEMAASPSSKWVLPAATSQAVTSISAVPTSNEALPRNEEITIPSSLINATVPDSKAVVKEVEGKSNVKEAAFSSILGFAFLSIAIILGGFALLKADKKSKGDFHPLKATV